MKTRSDLRDIHVGWNCRNTIRTSNLNSKVVLTFAGLNSDFTRNESSHTQVGLRQTRIEFEPGLSFDNLMLSSGSSMSLRM